MPATSSIPSHAGAGGVAGSATLVIGVPVRCDEGPCGVLSRLVVDPTDNTVTHLVVEPPHHHHALGRLVPVALLADGDGDGDGELRLTCSLDAFRALRHAEKTEFLEGESSWRADNPGVHMDYSGMGAMVWPYYSGRTPVTYESVPLGEVEVRRGDHIHSTTGAIGKVQGLVIGPADRHVTHVLVQRGHLWGAKDIAIPIGAVTSIDTEGVHVSLSKDDIGALPEVALAA
jgi:sporulation protein YlmC with PRC-barrel domain